MRGEEVVAGGIVIPERSVAPVIGRNMDAENHQRPDDGGGQRQRLEVSSERGGGPPGEPGEPEHDRADARPDDRAVREGIDVRANESETHDRPRQGAEQGRPRRPRSQEEENRSHDQAAECPHSREDGVVVSDRGDRRRDTRGIPEHEQAPLGNGRYRTTIEDHNNFVAMETSWRLFTSRAARRSVRGNSWKRGTPSPSSTFGTRRTFHWTRSPA